MYLVTTPQAVGPPEMFDPMYEPLDGGGGAFGGVSQSFAELGCPVVTIHNVLNAFSKLYE